MSNIVFYFFGKSCRRYAEKRESTWIINKIVHAHKNPGFSCDEMPNDARKQPMAKPWACHVGMANCAARRFRGRHARRTIGTMDNLTEDIAAADTLALKQVVRAMALAARDAISPEARAAKSADICRELLKMLDAELTAFESEGEDPRERHPNRNAGGRGRGKRRAAFTVGAYAAFEKEVNLDAFIVGAYQRGCAVAFPCMNRDPERGVSLPMIMRRVGRAAYERGDVPFISSPIEAFEEDEDVVQPYPVVKPADLDMLVVPLVAFDAQSNRLGYGGGNYDTFLPELSPACAVVGAAFAEQRVPEVPLEPHDMPLPAIASA